VVLSRFERNQTKRKQNNPERLNNMKAMMPIGKLYLTTTLIAVAIGILATPAYADNVTAWGGGGTDNNWTDGANWNAFGGSTAPANDGTRDVWVSWTGNTRTDQIVDTPYSVNSIFLPNTMPNPITLSGSDLTVVGAPPTGGGEGAIGVQGGSLIINNNVSISSSIIELLVANNGLLTLNGAVTTGAGSVTTLMNYNWNTFSSSSLILGPTASFTGTELDVVSITTGGVYGGTTLTLDNNNSLNDSLTLKLSEASLGNASDSAKLDLNFSGTQTVGGFSIDGVAQAAGTYGATGSGAMFIDDIHFLGTGMLLVTPVPEPSAGAIILVGSGLLIGFKRLRRRA
jgi:hypothetical protein